MKLFRDELVQYHECTRDIQDMRKKISKAVFSYVDDKGIEYRRSFKSVPYTSETQFWNIAPKEITI